MSMNLHLLMAVTQQARLPFVLDDKNNVGLLILTTNLYMWSVWLGEHFSLYGCRKIQRINKISQLVTTNIKEIVISYKENPQHNL